MFFLCTFSYTVYIQYFLRSGHSQLMVSSSWFMFQFNTFIFSVDNLNIFTEVIFAQL